MAAKRNIKGCGGGHTYIDEQDGRSKDQGKNKNKNKLLRYFYDHFSFVMAIQKLVLAGGLDRKSYKSHWDLVKPAILTNAKDTRQEQQKNKEKEENRRKELEWVCG